VAFGRKFSFLSMVGGDFWERKVKVGVVLFGGKI